jgi:hypothetical protein
MNEPRSFASLTSGLLARKGAAKPAMRPQNFQSMTGGYDDLGWNDMGQPIQRHVVPADVVPQVVIHQADIAAGMGAVQEEPLAPPATAIEAPSVPPVKADVVPISRAHPGLNSAGKAAFTLRLDPERHLRLRLACAVDHRSAQQIVTKALDEYLSGMPEIDALAGKLPVRSKR